MQEKKEKVA